MGPSVQTKWFQRWLNVFNIQGTLYPDLIADGFIGPRTISALKAIFPGEEKRVSWLCSGP
jgi:lysozyme family protein